MKSSYILLFIGLLSALFFSFTFLINRSISLDGGHWFWSASLRYFYTLLFISIILIIFKGFSFFKEVLNEFTKNFLFWSYTGILGFGVFYALLCFASEYSPAWIIATTWQITIIASLLVLFVFGRKLSLGIWICTVVIFIGISMVNISQFDITDIPTLMYGFISVIVAAFVYPYANQLIWEEKEKRKKKKFKSLDVLDNAFAKVFLMTLGSSPLWLLIYLFVDVGLPSSSQAISVVYISLFSGVIATSLFLYVRQKANSPAQLILVDATQSGEVFFSLWAEIIFLGAVLPSLLGLSGLGITIIALLYLVYFSQKNKIKAW